MEEVSPWLLFGMSLLVALGLCVISIAATRRLELVPRSRLQLVAEMAVGAVNNLATEIIGPKGRNYTAFLGTIFIYILVSNFLGLIPGLKSPTSNLSLIIPIALLVFVMYNFYGIREQGILRYLKHLAGEPLWLAPLMLPVHLISEIARPMSLSIRLFGNIFVEETILTVLAGMSVVILNYLVAVPFQFPIIFLALITGFVQALVFTILTAIYISLAIEGNEGH